MKIKLLSSLICCLALNLSYAGECYLVGSNIEPLSLNSSKVKNSEEPIVVGVEAFKNNGIVGRYVFLESQHWIYLNNTAPRVMEYDVEIGSRCGDVQTKSRLHFKLNTHEKRNLLYRTLFRVVFWKEGTYQFTASTYAKNYEEQMDQKEHSNFVEIK